MNSKEKRELRAFIGQYLDVSNARLRDHEAIRLHDFIVDYDWYRGRVLPLESRRVGWSSDGKYIRTEIYTYTFIDDVGIREEYHYYDDDGHSGGAPPREIRDARGILTWLENHESQLHR